MGINKHFGTLVDGVITYAPRPLVVGGRDVWTDDAGVYLSCRYKAVATAQRPADAGYTYTSSWTEDNTTITQTWTGAAVEPVADADALRDAQIQSLSDRSDFVEDCIAEMAAVIYA